MDRFDCGTGGPKRMSDYEPLGLHVPKPSVRPGDKPDFSGVKIARAGTVKRPPVDVAPEDIRDLGYTIIRVLNRDAERSEEHTSELQSLMRISYAVFCLKKKNQTQKH